jgi:hypothetical protein
MFLGIGNSIGVPQPYVDALLSVVLNDFRSFVYGHYVNDILLGEPTAPRSKVENGSLPHESGAIPVRTIHEFQLANDFRAGSENIFTVRLVRTFSGNWFVHVIPFLSQDRRGDNRLLDMGEALHDLRPREAQGVWP